MIDNCAMYNTKLGAARDMRSISRFKSNINQKISADAQTPFRKLTTPAQVFYSELEMPFGILAPHYMPELSLRHYQIPNRKEPDK